VLIGPKIVVLCNVKVPLMGRWPALLEGCVKAPSPILDCDCTWLLPPSQAHSPINHNSTELHRVFVDEAQSILITGVF